MSDITSVTSDLSHTGSTLSLRQKSNLFKMKSRLSQSLNRKVQKFTRNKVSLNNGERLSPMFFDGPGSSISAASDELHESDEFLYRKMGKKLDREHVKSGKYQERAVDAEFDHPRPVFQKRNYSKRRSKPRSPKIPSLDVTARISTSSSDFDKCRLRISNSGSDSTFPVGSETETEPDQKSYKSLGTKSEKERLRNSIAKQRSRPDSIKSIKKYEMPLNGEPQESSLQESSLTVDKDDDPKSNDDDAFYRTPLTSSINSTKSATSDISTASTGSFTRLRNKSDEKRRDSITKEYGKKRMGQIWRERESPAWNDIAENDHQDVISFDDFEVDWSTFDANATHAPSEAIADDIAIDIVDPESGTDNQLDEFESTDIPDSIFGSLPSTPTDVTSLWGDFPADANEAFSDALEELQNENTYDDRILEETEVIVQQTVEIDGVQHFYLHKAKWDDMLFIFDNPVQNIQLEEGQMGKSKSRYTSIETLKNDSAKSPNSLVDTFKTPRVSPEPSSTEIAAPTEIPPKEVTSDNELWSDQSVSDRSSGSSVDEDENETDERISHASRPRSKFRRLLKSMGSEKTTTTATSTDSFSTKISSPATSRSPSPSVRNSLLQQLTNEFINKPEQERLRYHSPSLSLSESLCSSTSDTSDDIKMDLQISHGRTRSNLSTSDIDMLSDVERKVLIKEQLADYSYLPPLPSEPIYDFPYDSDVTDSDDTDDLTPRRRYSLPCDHIPRHAIRRPRPPPIPPRLSERTKKAAAAPGLVAPVAAVAAVAAVATPVASPVPVAAATSGLDDLAGAFDTPVPSSADVHQGQTQANKMASIMGAFGGPPSNPPMGNAFGQMGGQMPAGNPAGGQMFGGMGMGAPAGGQMGGQMANPMAGQFGGMGSPAPPQMGGQMGGQMAANPMMGQMNQVGAQMGQNPMGQQNMGMQNMTNTVTNNVMGMNPSPVNNAMTSPPSASAKADPFASLGSLTGLKPKEAPAPKMSMGQMNMATTMTPSGNQSVPQNNFNDLFG